MEEGKHSSTSPLLGISTSSNGTDDEVVLVGRGGSTSTSTSTSTFRRPTYVIVLLLAVILIGSLIVNEYQFGNLPLSQTALQAGKTGFSEQEAINHLQHLTSLGPHPVASNALDIAIQYVYEASEDIKRTAHSEVDVQVELFPANPGSNSQLGGLFKGKTLIYADIKHVVLRILPKRNASEVGKHAILVSAHIDSVFSGEGAGDDGSSIAVMLELARGISHSALGFKNAVIFLFNTGEEEGLNGAHSFVTQHPWTSTLRMAIDLEANGIGGKSAIFQAGPDPWAIENFAMVAKYPSGQVLAQDLFNSGAISSATDFQVYRDIAGLSGLDFAYSDKTAVYHTKNDKLKLLKAGSLQHLGENMLAFLLHAAASSHLSTDKAMRANETSPDDNAIYFDILGAYMIVFRQRFAKLVYDSVIVLMLLVGAAVLLIGGYKVAISSALACLSVILMWICSLILPIIVAFILPQISSSPIPFMASPWLVAGLFGAPALLGAFTGQHMGYLILKRYFSHISSERNTNLSQVSQDDWARVEAERWLYKGGLMQWFILLIVGNYLKVGSSYLALVWLLSPALAYGLLEATLSPAKSPKLLKELTLLIGLFLPCLISGGMFIRMASLIIGNAVKFDTNPGGLQEWLVNVILAVYIAAAICLTLVYFLSYVHISGAKAFIVAASCILFGLSLIVVLFGILPPFSEETARGVNVVHVVDTTGKYGQTQEPSSYVSLFSMTPGNLNKEAEQIGEEFVCGRERVLDMVTFHVTYSCWTHNDTESGWSESDIPTMHVVSDTRGDDRTTQVSVNTKVSTRGALAINTEKIKDFTLKANNAELIMAGNKSSKNGWHIIQFSGGRNAPKTFNLTLYWATNDTHSDEREREEGNLLLKLRTDVDRVTPKIKSILAKLPPWCSLYGKSTSPKTLAFISSLPVNF